ncbi:DUF4192 domain-containing protein [Streptomyces albus]
MVALHGERGRFGGRIRIGIPTAESTWSPLAPQIAECLDASSRARGAPPDGALIFVCQEPEEGGSGRDVMERLRPLVQALRLACGQRDMPVYEALCLSDGRFFSYCCPDESCCPPEGVPLSRSRTSAMAVAAAYAGIPVRGSLREMERRLLPLGPPLGEEQQRALDRASLASRSPRACCRRAVDRKCVSRRWSSSGASWSASSGACRRRGHTGVTTRTMTDSSRTTNVCRGGTRPPGP